MNRPNPEAVPYLVATCVRAFMLYSLAEFQSGNATTIRVTANGSEFGIWDDGRGHPLDKSVEGTSYLRFIYEHFDYPFQREHGAPVQLQGIGMSLVNALCRELHLEVRKPNETLHMAFGNGKAIESGRTATHNERTGISVVGRLRPEFSCTETDTTELAQWLTGVLRVHPSLHLSFNGSQLSVPVQGDA